MDRFCIILWTWVSFRLVLNAIETRPPWPVKVKPLNLIYHLNAIITAKFIKMRQSPRQLNVEEIAEGKNKYIWLYHPWDQYMRLKGTTYSYICLISFILQIFIVMKQLSIFRPKKWVKCTQMYKLYIISGRENGIQAVYH